MSDQTRNKDDDEQEFSLNKFDLNDDDTKEADSDDLPHAPDESKAFVDSAFEDHKHEPSVPDFFEAPQQANDAQTINAKTINHSDTMNVPSDDAFFSAPHVEQASMSADPQPIDDDDFAALEEPAQHDSSNKTIIVFVVLASVVVALLAWFSLTGDDREQQGLHTQAAPQTSDPVHGGETQLTLLQQRLSSAQADLILKNKQIAELTHQLSEQRRQLKAMSIKRSSATKKTAVVQKRIQPIKASTTPIHQPSGTGSWAIIVASVNSRAAADKAQARLKAKGIAADISPITVKGKAWFRIRVSGFASRAEAEIQKKYLAQRYGMKGTWLHQSK